MYYAVVPSLRVRRIRLNITVTFSLCVIFFKLLIKGTNGEIKVYLVQVDF